MYMFQEREVDRIADMKDDIESGLTTYNMKVGEAKGSEKEVQKLEEEESRLDTEREMLDHHHEIARLQVMEFVTEVGEKKKMVDSKVSDKRS